MCEKPQAGEPLINRTVGIAALLTGLWEPQAAA